MNKNDLIRDIAERTGFTKHDTSIFMDAYEAAVLDAIRRNERVYLHNFMRLERKTRKAHQGYDFRTKSTLTVPERETIGVELGKAFFGLLNNN